MQACICLLEDLKRPTIITFNPSFWSGSSFRDPEFYGGAFSKTSQKEMEEGRFLSSSEGRFQARESIRGG
jgi:hypothetical protein